MPPRRPLPSASLLFLAATVVGPVTVRAVYADSHYPIPPAAYAQTWGPPNSSAVLATLAATLLTALIMAVALGLTSSPSAVWARFAPPRAPRTPSPRIRGGHHPGIFNAGNTCFMNATLQALGSVPAFLSELDAARQAAEANDLAVPVSDASASLWAELNVPRARPWAVHATVVARALAAPRPGGWNARTLTGAHEQQDAHELLLVLLDALQDEGDRTRRYRAEYAHLLRDGLRSLLCLPRDDPADALESQGGLGSLQSLVGRMTRCLVCGYTAGVRANTSPVLELTPTKGDLVSCLLHWAAEERVEWTCWRCSIRRTQSRLAARLQHLQAAVLAQSAPGPVETHTNGDLGKLSASAKRRKKKKVRKDQTRAADDLLDLQVEAGRTARVLSQIARILRDNLSEDEVEENGALPLPLPPVTVDAGGLATPPPEAAASKAVSEAVVPPGSYDELWTELRSRGDRFPNVAATRQALLRGGDVLPIHLSRSSFFGGGAVKNSAFIAFPETLALPPQGWFEPQLTDEEALALSLGMEQAALLGVKQARLAQLKADFSTYAQAETYRLMAVVVHLGMHGYGHYIAFRRRPTAPDSEEDEVEFDDALSDPASAREEWLRISDADVRPCSLAEVLSQSAYLLFYQKVGTESKGGQIGPVAVPSTMGAHRRRLKPRTVLRPQV